MGSRQSAVEGIHDSFRFAIESAGIKPIDALHVASFEASESNYFITCDRRLLNRCQALAIPAINPIDFIKELDNEN